MNIDVLNPATQFLFLDDKKCEFVFVDFSVEALLNFNFFRVLLDRLYLPDTIYVGSVRIDEEDDT